MSSGTLPDAPSVNPKRRSKERKMTRWTWNHHKPCPVVGRTGQERKKPERPAISRNGYCKLNVLLTDGEQFIPGFADGVRRAEESIAVVNFVMAAFAADVFKM